MPIELHPVRQYPASFYHAKVPVKSHQNDTNDDRKMKRSNAKARSSKGVEDINQLSFQKSFASLMQSRYGAPKSYAERQKKVKYIGNALSVKLRSLRLPLRKSSTLERLHQGKHAYTRRRRKQRVLTLSRNGAQSMPDLNDFGT